MLPAYCSTRRADTDAGATGPAPEDEIGWCGGERSGLLELPPYSVAELSVD